MRGRIGEIDWRVGRRNGRAVAELGAYVGDERVCARYYADDEATAVVGAAISLEKAMNTLTSPEAQAAARAIPPPYGPALQAAQRIALLAKSPAGRRVLKLLKSREARALARAVSKGARAAWKGAGKVVKKLWPF
jgi:hypothetical protein